jgi:sulfur carrier protein ThiS
MQKILNYQYTNDLSTYKSINDYIPNSTESTQTDKSLEDLKVKLLERNTTNTALIFINKKESNLEIMPRKIFVSNIFKPFEYFQTELPTNLSVFTLPDGMIFRVANGNILPKEQYTHYIIQNGMYKLIPNYQTVEVLLKERNVNYLSVRIIEESQFNELINGGIYVNLNSQWNSSLIDNSGII